MTLEPVIKLEKKNFQQLFDNHFNALCAFGVKYVSDPDVVEDFIQESFVSLWEQREQFENERAIKAYLYTSARNKCLNHLKHLAVRQKHEDQLIYELESDHFFTNHVVEEEAFNELHLAIKALPQAAQSIMILALKGLKNKEIAEKLQISENTVKTQKKIAYNRIKERVSPVLSAIVLCL